MAIKFTESAVQTASNSYEQYKKLKEQLNKIDSQYDTTYREPQLDLPESLNLKKLEYTMPTEEQILSAAKGQNLADYNKKTQQLNSEKESYKLSNTQKQKQLQEDADSKKEEINQSLSEQLRRIGEQVINSGLAHSSISSSDKEEAGKRSEEQSAAVEREKDVALQQLAEQLQLKLAQSAQEMQALKEAYESDVQESVDKLTEDARKKYDDVLKYNNTVEEKEQKYQVQREEALADARKDEEQRISDLIELYATVGESGIEARKSNDKLKYVTEFFDSVDKQTALAILNSDPTLKGHLGVYYDYVVDRVNSKKD